MYTGEEPLGVEAQQGESLNLCHGSKGPWLEVSFDVTCSAQVLSVLPQGGREDAQDERSRQAWIGDKVETKVSTLCSTSLNSVTPQGLPSLVTTTTNLS
jgi:hypothetical protein